jgi:hypothetical protein
MVTIPSMFRTYGRPDVQREDQLIDQIGARVRKVRRATLVGVVALSLAVACVVVWVAAAYAAPELGGPITGTAIGALGGGALLGTMFKGHALAARLTVLWAERLARTLATERHCEEEPLVEAARLLAGGR